MARAAKNKLIYDLFLSTDQLEIASQRKSAAKKMYAY